MLKKNLLLLVAFLFTLNSYCQNLKEHQWKNRLVLIITKDLTSDIFKRQNVTLASKTEELKQRKILVYKIIPKNYQLEYSNKNIIQNDNMFRKYNKADNIFKIILIGLDGGIKLEQTEFLSTEKLFAIIDGMPMRRSEIRNNKN